MVIGYCSTISCDLIFLDANKYLRYITFRQISDLDLFSSINFLLTGSEADAR